MGINRRAIIDLLMKILGTIPEKCQLQVLSRINIPENHSKSGFSDPVVNRVVKKFQKTNTRCNLPRSIQCAKKKQQKKLLKPLTGPKTGKKFGLTTWLKFFSENFSPKYSRFSFHE